MKFLKNILSKTKNIPAKDLLSKEEIQKLIVEDEAAQKIIADVYNKFKQNN